MKRTPIIPDFSVIPEQFHTLLEGSAVYDSSCSPAARVYYIEKEGGLFLKAAEKGTLQQEGALDSYFHSLGLGPEVLKYHSGEKDWLLTRRIPGEDCLDTQYLAQPERLAETMAELLLHLHSQNPASCPVPDHTARYLQRAATNYETKNYDMSFFPDNWGYATPEEAWAVIEANAKYLKTDTLLHGDYCLPNIMLQDWKPAGFIDLGNGGVGDKHVDLFWGAWTLDFNLKDNRFGKRFLDAYGRNRFEPEMLRLIGAIEVFG